MALLHLSCEDRSLNPRFQIPNSEDGSGDASANTEFSWEILLMERNCGKKYSFIQPRIRLHTCKHRWIWAFPTSQRPYTHANKHTYMTPHPETCDLKKKRKLHYYGQFASRSINSGHCTCLMDSDAPKAALIKGATTPNLYCCPSFPFLVVATFWTPFSPQ